jgi:hypothetical protein
MKHQPIQLETALDPVTIALRALRKALERLPDCDQHKLHALAVNDLGFRLYLRGDIYMTPRTLDAGLKVLLNAGVTSPEVERLVALAQEWMSPPV